MESSSTMHPTGKASPTTPAETSLKPTDPRRSNDQQSQPDSDASYDLVSGATSAVPSQAPGSPRQVKKVAGVEESEEEEEDWE